MTRTFILFIAILFISTAKADCLACWELRKVKITLTNSDTLSGFVQWNEAWLPGITGLKEWRNKFPESLVPFYYYRNLFYGDSMKILVIKDLVIVKNDSMPEFKATTPDNLLRFDHSAIKTIVELDDNSEKYNGAGDIPTFTLGDLNKLQTNPYAIILIDGIVADIYILSYNPEITRKQLELINADNYGNQIDELNKQGVITVNISYD